MDRRCFEDTCEQIIPETFDLHILPADQPQIDQHIQTHEKLNNAPGILVIPDIQKHPQCDGTSDVAEVEQVKDIVFGQPPLLFIDPRRVPTYFSSRSSSIYSSYVDISAGAPSIGGAMIVPSLSTK